MRLRSFRTLLLLAFLIGLLILSGELAVRATTPSTHAGRNFRPTGHGVVYPQRINTAKLAHTNSLGSTAMNMSSSVPSKHPLIPALHTQLPPPQNVVNVPPPTSTDPRAKPGLSQKVSQQPDANGAGGLDNYLETVNRSVGIFSRSGNIQKATSYQAWFNLSGATIYDPVAMWDNTGSRFIFSVDDSGAALLLSVAQQTDATGSWCNYTFRSPSGLLADFDKLGVDSDGIYFSANLLSPSTGNVVSNELFFASRTALESCQKATYTSWQGLTNPDGSIAQAITPARQDTSAGGVEYLINSYPSGACQLTLWTLTSSGNLFNTSVPTQCYSPSPAAKQKGTTTRLIVDDSSITQASYINGLLTVDNLGSYDWGDGNGPVGIVEWYVLNPSTASVSSQGAFGTKGYWLYYPSTITTPNGHMLFVYNASGPTSYVSVWYVNQVLTTTTALVNGTGPYGTGSAVGWGDYQSAWQDASGASPNAVWITGAYATSSNSWSTKFDLVSP